LTVNPLVAGPVVTSTAVSGLGVVESVSDLCLSLRSGSWVAAGLAGVGAALDVAASVIDPLGSLIGAGLGWLMDHLEPLKGWLNDLAGDAGAVLGFAGTWDNIAAAMSGASGELTRVVRADLELMSGDSIDAYRVYAQGLAAKIGSTGESAAAMSSALQVCAQVVQAVHDVVRDTLAQLAGSIISWAAEAVFTLGLATPVIVGQVSTRVSALATRIGKHVTDVVHTAKNLKGLLESLGDLLRRLGGKVSTPLPGGRRPGPLEPPRPVEWAGPNGLRLTPGQRAAVDDFMREAASSEPGITRGVQRSVEGQDGSMLGLDYRLKGADSLYRKVATVLAQEGSPGADAVLSSLKDTVRYTASFPETRFSSSVTSVVDDLLRQGHTPVAWKNTFGDQGYQGINSAWRSTTGQVYELQFHTPTSFDVKMSTHELYEQLRLPGVAAAEQARLASQMNQLFASVPLPEGVRSIPVPEVP